MKRILLSCLLSFLAACTPGTEPQDGGVTISGVWTSTVEVSASSCEDITVGNTNTSDITFTTNGDEVTATSPNGTTATGTRDGNVVTLTRSGTTENGDSFEVQSEVFFEENVFSGSSLSSYSNGCSVSYDVSGTRRS